MPARPDTGVALELRGITKRYGTTAAVEDVSLAIEDGEFLTLLGPSGSGKTTLLNIVAGFATANAGEVLLRGREISALAPHKRNIGVVFQHYALFPHLSVHDNVAFPLKRRGVKRPDLEQRVRAALELVDLRGLAERLPRQLSGGQQQRVALARALVFEPPLLLMDEPLGALDRQLREALQVEIKRIHREVGSTFVYVTHDQEEALALSDRVAVLRSGRIEQVGTGAELYERPRTRFVATFIGDSSVLEGTVLDKHDGRVVITCPGVADVVTTSRSDLRRGDPACVVIRPENLRLVAPAEGPDGADNTVDATLEQVLYLGANRKATVLLANGQRLTVSMRGREALPVAEGQPARVTWNADDAVLVRADGRASTIDSPAVQRDDRAWQD
jgi:putative spermidine/putrescine transport system ATP-binding protein